MGRERPFSFQQMWQDGPALQRWHLTACTAGKKLVMGKLFLKKVGCWFLGPTCVPKINICTIIPWACQVRGKGWGRGEMEGFPVLFVEQCFFNRTELKGWTGHFCKEDNKIETKLHRKYWNGTQFRGNFFSAPQKRIDWLRIYCLSHFLVSNMDPFRSPLSQ